MKQSSGSWHFDRSLQLRKLLLARSNAASLWLRTGHFPSEHVTQQFDHYELVKGEDGKPVELGRGAMGVTYKAFDIDLRRPVTLKVVSERYLGDESARLRFVREARAAASLRHPNVAAVFHLGTTGENYFYTMEFVEGETLATLIKRSGRVEVKLALEIAAQIAAGLAAVHKQKLVHRDIKPSNIMVSSEEPGAVTVKIIDLGLAKAVSEQGPDSAISTPGSFVGTAAYASPEQFAGVDLDIRSDLYSLGAMLWEMVTGRPLFTGSLGEVMYQHQHAPLPREQLEGLPEPVVALIGLLLEKDPARRFQTPAELLKVMHTTTDAIEAGQTIAYENLRQIPASGAFAVSGKTPKRQGPEKISVAKLPVTGSGGGTSSADEFFDAALAWFGDPNPRIGTAWEKGERLATLIANRRVLLVLDGLEQLSSDAGARLLRALRVKGNEAELRRASDEFSGHCLALTLLGSYLTDAYNGDIRYGKEVSARLAHDARQGAHARNVMESYQNGLARAASSQFFEC
ncbi:MAG: serine/threonine-protein kinase [Terrimicrobiaceae bacterium]